MAWQLEGTYFENCSCDMVCPCTTSGLTMPADQDRCRVVLAFHIDRGEVDGLDLSDKSVVVVAGMNLVFNALFVALIVRARDLGTSATGIGLMLGGYGLGGVLGSLAAPALHRRLPGRLILVGTAWAWAGLLGLLPLMPSALWLGAVAAAASLLGPAFNVVLAAHLYRVTPDELLGRVRSTVRLVAWGAIPVGSLLGGAAAEALGARLALAVVAVAMLPVAVATSLSPGMRELPGRHREDRAATGFPGPA